MIFFGMFFHFVVTFLLTVLVFFQLPYKPPLWAGLLVLCIALLSVVLLRPILTRYFNINQSAYRHEFVRVVNIFMGFLIGANWVFWQTFFQPVIQESAFNHSIYVRGKIIDLPLVEENSQRPGQQRIAFKMALDSIEPAIDSLALTLPQTAQVSSLSKSDDVQQNERKQNHQAWSFMKPQISLSWYQNADVANSPSQAQERLPKQGDVWRFKVKLKAVHGAMNPGARDYETWLFQNHIVAKGYVKSTANEALSSYAQKLSSAGLWTWRQSLADQLTEVFRDSPYGGIYQGLTYGDKSSMNSEQWQILQQTGTIHLMAISGLHMGMVAFLGYLFFKGLWWMGLYRVDWINLPVLGAFGALLFATLYLLISGAAIPTQRAWIMVASIVAFLMVQRRFQPWSALAFAALVVVVWDSRAVLSFGFWLSFMAVLLIFSSLQAFRGRKTRRWQPFLVIQFILTIGLAPFLVWAFGSLPIYSFLANLIAVPFVTVIGLPLLFATSVIGLFSVESAQFLINQLDILWSGLWWFLQWVNELPYQVYVDGTLSLGALFSLYTILGVALFTTSPRIKQAGLVVYSLSFIGLLVWSNAPRPLINQAWISVLDVGQGLAIVVETQNHVVVYDTGPQWGESMDGAKMAIVPYLRHQHWSQVNQLIVSHSDLDHAGGVLSLLKSLPVTELRSGQSPVLNNLLQKDAAITSRFSPCLAGQQWRYDGIQFEILSPFEDEIAKTFKTDNDLSCVLKISQGEQAVIITGDLSSRAEAVLVARYGQSLQGDLLIAGHHGSKYSTSDAWLASVKPKIVVFSAGYLNRFQFPNQATLQRLPPEVAWFNTACAGALTFQMGGLQSNRMTEGTQAAPIKLFQQTRKAQHKWYHHSCLKSQQGILFQ